METPHTVQRGTPKEYGYTVWVPGLVLGVVFAAAAVAKLRDAGVAWILNGTVKYHFLSDSVQAMVDWGLWIGRHHWLSVLLSFGAIAIETLVIVGVAARRLPLSSRGRRRGARPARWASLCCRDCSGQAGGCCCCRSCRGTSYAVRLKPDTTLA